MIAKMATQYGLQQKGKHEYQIHIFSVLKNLKFILFIPDFFIFFNLNVRLSLRCVFLKHASGTSTRVIEHPVLCQIALASSTFHPEMKALVKPV